MIGDNKKFLVVGVKSLFGDTLVSYLMDEYPGCDITTTCRPDDSVQGIREAYNRKLDLSDKDSIAALLAEVHPDVIFYLESQNSVGYAWENPKDTIEINVNWTLNVLDAVRTLDYVPRIVIAGSAEEYGEIPFSQIPSAEDIKVNPRNIFAASKACQTMMCQLYVKAYKMDIVILRTFNEIGPGQSERFAVSNFCKQFAAIEKGTHNAQILVGNINIKRDFTDYRDLTKAFIAVAEKGRQGEVYNAGRGKAVTIKSVLDMLEDITGISAEYVADSARIRPVDAAVMESDNTRIYADTGWKPNHELEQTIKDMLYYWRNCTEQ